MQTIKNVLYCTKYIIIALSKAKLNCQAFKGSFVTLCLRGTYLASS